MAVTEKGATAAATNALVEIRLADSEKHTMTLNLPAPLRDAVKADAAKRDLSDTSIAREILAAHYGFNILDNASTRVGKYVGLTKEQKAKIRKDERDSKNKRVNAIMEAIKAGKIPADVLASLGIEV